MRCWVRGQSDRPDTGFHSCARPDDDLIMIPLGIALAITLIPAEVMRECRQEAIEASHQMKQKNWIAGGMIITVWVAIGALLLKLLTAEIRR